MTQKPPLIDIYDRNRKDSDSKTSVRILIFYLALSVCLQYMYPLIFMYITDILLF